MTNYIKKIIATLALGMCLVTPALAQEHECRTKVSIAAEISDKLKQQPLTETDIKNMVDKVGPPPNAKADVPLEAVLVFNDEVAAVNVFQNDCFIARLGPAMREAIFGLLGITLSAR